MGGAEGKLPIRSGGVMKYVLGSALLMLAVSAPAFGQSISGEAINPMPANVPMLPHYAPSNPQMIELSGSFTDFFPSVFMAFDKAVAKGTAANNTPAISVVEAARENRAEQKPKAKAVFMQDGHGNAILVKKR
jgi:hypothetical protein